MEKLRLDYFLSLGLKLVESDVYSIGGDTVTCDSKHLDAQNEVCASNKHRLITSFAWRSDFNNGYLNHPNKLIDVKRGVLNYAISHWRYNINELIKMQNEHDKKIECKQRAKVTVSCLSDTENARINQEINDGKWSPLAIEVIGSNHNIYSFDKGDEGENISLSFENFTHGILREQMNNNKPQVDEKCRIEYMNQDTSSLTIAEFTLKFETEKEYCGLDKKGYCLSVPKADFIAWHPVDERSELDIAKEAQVYSIYKKTVMGGHRIDHSTVKFMQAKGMLAEISLSIKK